MLLALCLSWLLCFVLTVTNALPTAPTAYGHLARTDTKGNVLSQAPWFRFPYPGNEKIGPLSTRDMCFPVLSVGSSALNGELTRGRGWIASKRSDKEEQALGGPYETPKRRRRPLGCPKNLLGMLDQRLPFRDLPLLPFSMLLRTRGLRAARSERSRPSSRSFGSLPGLVGFYPREP